MFRSIPPFMDEARRLVSAGRLGEATALIQARLGAPVAEPPPAPFQGPTIELAAERPASAGGSAPGDAPPRSRPRFSLAGAADLLGSTRAAPTLPAGAKFLSLQHAGPAGRRAYRLYVPGGPSAAPRPLVVMLHGCTQGPEDFAVGTRMNELAEERGVLVAYPEQDRGANASLCWNWFEPSHQRRGAGEPAILAGMVEDVAARYPVDRSRIFAAGLSAGGAMAAVLGATYPDLFAAVGIHSGLPHGSARDVASALSVMRSGRSGGSRAARDVRTIVFHGARDTTVHPANGERVAGLEQAEAGRDSTTQGGTINGRAFTRTLVGATVDQAAAEHWRVEDLGHAWSGGDPDGSYADPAGPDASREMMRFFLDGESGARQRSGAR